MDLNAQKEKFSDAYLQAVVAVAGFGLAKPMPDDDSIDWLIISSGSHGLMRRPQIGIQLKCTARGAIRGSERRFPLERKTYDDLRAPVVISPRILVVVLVPDDLDKWLHQTEDQMLIRHCAYWVSLRGLSGTPNETTVTVHVPRSHVLTPGTLRDMMRRVNDTGAL